MDSIATLGVRNLPTRPKPLADLYWEFIEEAILAERLGFDNVWASEHHFSPDQWNPAPIVTLAAVATRTDRIRLGTYVLLLPLHNPVRIAEDVAVLDNISRGRVDLAVGAGSAPAEFHTLGVPMNQRMARTYEALTIIERCFREDEFSHRGKYYDFPNVRMTSKPAQAGGPPIWVSAMGQQSAAIAGRRGYNQAAGTGPGHAKWEESLKQSGHDLKERKVASIPIRIHLSATLEQAWDEAEEGLHQVLSFYGTRVGAGAGRASADLPPVGEFRRAMRTGRPSTPFIVGTPEDALEQLSQFRGRGVTHLGLNFHHPGMDTVAVRRSMELYAKEMMPEIRRW
jgi:alkanesulfonate monooxygenase SsuD/methylene tetrahydromethanopterin reductase-like flavin-dependent oxidoreductase (luciferase family)